MQAAWAITTLIVSFGLTAILGIWFIPFLRRLKYGQTILDIGPSWHKTKQGTPTMGGILFIIGISAGIAVGFGFVAAKGGVAGLPDGGPMAYRMFLGLVMALAFGFVGFVDDYIKVVRKQNLGLTAAQKLVMQLLIGAVYLAGMYIGGGSSTIVILPFLGQYDLGFFYYPLALMLIGGMVNAVNFTDGIDGLASSVTLVVGIAFLAISTLLNQVCSSVMSVALIGGCLGFLIWNFNPAKVFMGDTGSLFLGGLVVALGFGCGLPAFLIPIGIVYICELASVVLQVISFKTTGKRIFKMSPIHHHYEMSGYNEKQIVLLFSFVAALFGGLAVWAVFIL